MIEIMPFLHIMASIIEAKMIGSSSHDVMATIMVAFSSSTILTGRVIQLIKESSLFFLGLSNWAI